MTLDDVPSEPETREPTPEHLASRRRLQQVLHEVGVDQCASGSAQPSDQHESDSSSVASEDDDEEVEAITAQQTDVDFMNGVIYFERVDPEPVTALTDGTHDLSQHQFDLANDYLR